LLPDSTLKATDGFFIPKTAKEHSTSLQCDLTGDLLLLGVPIVWNKNGTQLENSTKYNINSIDNGTSILTVNRIGKFLIFLNIEKWV